MKFTFANVAPISHTLPGILFMSSIFHPTCDYMCRHVEVYATHMFFLCFFFFFPTNKRFKSTCNHTVFTCEICGICFASVSLDPASQLLDSGFWSDCYNTWIRFDPSPAGPGFGCVHHASFEALSGVEQRENTQKHPGQGSPRTRVDFLSSRLHRRSSCWNERFARPWNKTVFPSGLCCV